MLPVFLDFGFIKIYTFGVFIVLGFFWSLFLLWKLVALTAYKEEDVFDAVFIALLSGFITARVAYVLLNLSQFGVNILKIILINGYPGLWLYAGLAGGFLSFFLSMRRKKIPFMTIIDYMIPSLFIASAFIKIGAFLSGAEVGTQTHFFLKTLVVGYEGARHVTGLYEGIFFFTAVYISYKVLFLIRREKLPRGFGWYCFMSYFSLVYLLLDNIKENHLYFFGFSINFAVPLLFVIFFGLYFLIFFRIEIFKKIKSLHISIYTYVFSIIKNSTRKVQKKTHAG